MCVRMRKLSEYGMAFHDRERGKAHRIASYFVELSDSMCVKARELMDGML